MNPAQLLTHFDRIGEAPDAIPRLRRFILDLAVRGKLVEQDPRDEPASELLKQIQDEKTHLVKEGKIKAQEPQPSIAEGEIEYTLPANWVPTRIGDLLTVIRGASPRPKGDPKYFSIQRTPYHWIKISDIRKHSKDRILYDTDEFLTKAGMEKSVLLPKGTLVVTNSATIGVPIFLGFEGGCVHDGYLAFPYFPTSSLSQGFFYVLFQTLQSYAVKKARGMAQLNLNTGLVREFPLGLPPLAEQHRIVAKVDELMALCDRLEAAQTKRESRRDRLVASSLHHLNNGADADAFQEHARFYFNYLPRLTTRPDHIKQLRQTILNLAVRGKLVEQDPTDEPTSELLKRIGREKEQFIKKGTLRKEKPLAPVTEKAAPFLVPTSWSWARVGTCSLLTEYGTSVKSDNAEKGIPVLKMGDIQGGQVILDGQKKVPRQIEDLPQLFLKRFDLLYNRTNSAELVGKTGIYLGEDNAYTFASYLIRIRFINELMSPFYVNLAMNAQYFRETQIIPELKQQCGQANVNGTKLRNMLIPIPPLAEQHRIVTRVDELMTLCDQLETQLTTTQSESRHLLEAVLHEAMAKQTGKD